MIGSGTIILRGESARDFKKKFLDNPMPNKAAQESYERGVVMLEEFKKNGFVRIFAKKRK